MLHRDSGVLDGPWMFFVYALALALVLHVVINKPHETYGSKTPTSAAKAAPAAAPPAPARTSAAPSAPAAKKAQKTTPAKKSTKLAPAGKKGDCPSTIRQGASGDAARKAQQALSKRGYKVSVDGYLGADSELAIKSAQKDLGVTVDGIVGPTMWRAFGQC